MLQDEFRAIPASEIQQHIRAEQEIDFEIDDAGIDMLANDGYDPAYGARPVKRAIQRDLETPVARALVAGKYPPGSTIKVTAKDNSLRLE